MNEEDTRRIAAELHYGADFDPRLQCPDMNYTYMDAPYGILDIIDDEWHRETFHLPDIEPREKQPMVEIDNNIAAHRFFPKLQTEPDDDRMWVEEWLNESTKTNVDLLEKFL